MLDRPGPFFSEIHLAIAPFGQALAQSGKLTDTDQYSHDLIRDQLTLVS